MTATSRTVDIVDRLAPCFEAEKEPHFYDLYCAYMRLSAEDRACFDDLRDFGLAMFSRVDPDGFARIFSA